MMKKLKIVSIFVILILFISSISVLATDINMNLPTTNVTSNVNTTSNTSTNTVETNTLYATDDVTTTDIENDDLATTSYQPTTTVTSTSSTQNDSLGFSNILNILLIVVGFVLILLGIAIIIRIH